MEECLPIDHIYMEMSQLFCLQAYPLFRTLHFPPEALYILSTMKVVGNLIKTYNISQNTAPYREVMLHYKIVDNFLGTLTDKWAWLH